MTPSSQATEGLLLADAAGLAALGYSKEALSALLADKYMPVDLDRPGMRLHCFDPPVLTVDDYLAVGECDALVEGAKQTDALVVGPGSGCAGL